MTARRAVTSLVSALGVAVCVVAAAATAATLLVVLGLPDQGRAESTATAQRAAPPAELVVALSLGDPALQAGVVRDGKIVLARGLEVEVARGIARRLRIRHVRFVDVRPSARLLTAGSPAWSVAVASVRPSRAAAAAADLSVPYLATDQAVVPRRGLRELRSLVDLRGLVTCALRGSDGAAALTSTVRPVARPLLAPTSSRLLELVRTGVCDAALVDGVSVGRLLAGQGGRFGAVRARVVRGDGLVVAVARGGSVTVAEVDRALRGLRGDGTLHRVARSWLGIDPERLRPLR